MKQGRERKDHSRWIESKHRSLGRTAQGTGKEREEGQCVPEGEQAVPGVSVCL